MYFYFKIGSNMLSIFRSWKQLKGSQIFVLIHIRVSAIGLDKLELHENEVDLNYFMVWFLIKK